jgi:hypothetical protein
LTSLLILDLWGNPICREVEKYRLFIIYHLKSLRAFDGFAVEVQGSIDRALKQSAGPRSF